MSVARTAWRAAVLACLALFASTPAAAAEAAFAAYRTTGKLFGFDGSGRLIPAVSGVTQAIGVTVTDITTDGTTIHQKTHTFTLDETEKALAGRKEPKPRPELTDEQRAEMIAAAFGVLDDARFAPVFGPGSRGEVALTGAAADLPPGVVISGRSFMAKKPASAISWSAIFAACWRKSRLK